MSAACCYLLSAVCYLLPASCCLQFRDNAIGIGKWLSEWVTEPVLEMLSHLKSLKLNAYLVVVWGWSSAKVRTTNYTHIVAPSGARPAAVQYPGPLPAGPILCCRLYRGQTARINCWPPPDKTPISHFSPGRNQRTNKQKLLHNSQRNSTIFCKATMPTITQSLLWNKSKSTLTLKQISFKKDNGWWSTLNTFLGPPFCRRIFIQFNYHGCAVCTFRLDYKIWKL